MATAGAEIAERSDPGANRVGDHPAAQEGKVETDRAEEGPLTARVGEVALPEATEPGVLGVNVLDGDRATLPLPTVSEFDRIWAGIRVDEGTDPPRDRSEDQQHQQADAGGGSDVPRPGPEDAEQ